MWNFILFIDIELHLVNFRARLLLVWLIWHAMHGRLATLTATLLSQATGSKRRKKTNGLSKMHSLASRAWTQHTTGGALAKLYLKYVPVLILSKRFVLLFSCSLTEIINNIQQIGHITCDNASNNKTMVDEFAIQYYRDVGRKFDVKRALIRWVVDSWYSFWSSS